MRSDAALPGLFAPYFWHNFRAKYSTLLKQDGWSRSVAAEASLRILLFGLLQGSWLLDDIFARGWRKTRVRGPVFIVGHPRSGTTFLHRTLVEDAIQDAHALDFGMMLLPSILQRRITKFLLGSGTRRRSALTGLMNRLEGRLFGGFDHIHRLRFNELEEDEYAAWSIFASVFCISDSPSAMLSPELDYMRHPHQWRASQQRETAAWYRACLKKSVAASGNSDGLVIGKNTALTRNIGFISEQFPDAVFVYMVRNPVDAIASRMSLVEAIWRRRYPNMKGLSPEQVSFLKNDSIDLYLSAENALGRLNTTRVHTVIYDDLMDDPQSTVQEVAANLHLGQLKQGLSEALNHRAANRFPAPNRTHKYSLEDYGLSENELRSRLDVVFEKYGFDNRK